MALVTYFEKNVNFHQMRKSQYTVRISSLDESPKFTFFLKIRYESHPYFFDTIKMNAF